MRQTDLKPAGAFAACYGVKMLAYGPPGTGKTPTLNSAPRPLLLAVEPGLTSMRGSNIPTWDAFTPERLDEFFKWFFESNESKNFDTLGLDSVSQMAEIQLKRSLKRYSHGLKAYGDMSEYVMEKLDKLYYMQNKHMYLICKESVEEVGDSKRYRPTFPGKDLNMKIPHLFDLIGRFERFQHPSSVKPLVGIRTQESFGAMARSRFAGLDEMEPPNLAALFAKCMAAQYVP